MSEIATRIEAAYMALEGTDDPRGARAWFARRAHCHPTSVSRWLSGAMAMPGTALGLLEEMERRTGDLRRIEALQSRTHPHAKALGITSDEEALGALRESGANVEGPTISLQHNQRRLEAT